MSRGGNKYFIYGLIMTLLLMFIFHSSVNGKLIFCKQCKAMRNGVKFNQQTTEMPGAPTNLANIIRAPSKCKADEVLDQRQKCRRLSSN